MVAAGNVSYSPQTLQYHLPAEHAAVLVDETGPDFAAGLVNLAIPLVMASHPVMESFRTGRPVTSDVFHGDLWRGIERYSAPGYQHRLVQHWLPAVPAVVRTLEEGGTLVDVGCGAGRAAIRMAQVFPKARISGFDPFGPSIERARKNAATADVADRVDFRVGGARNLPADRFDVITTFDVVHHYSDPVNELAAVRRALTGNGTYLIFDAAISEHMVENANPWGLFIYGSSVMYCLHDSLANNGIGLGADFSEPRVRDIAVRAGFQRFRRVGVDDPTVAIYELRT
jgi:SAM-dependent methyltransferase